MCLFFGYLVLRGTGEGNFGLLYERPGTFAGVPFETVTDDGVEDALFEFEGGDLLNVGFGEAFVVAGDQRAFAVGEGKDFGAEFEDFERSVLRDVAYNESLARVR